MGTFKISDWIAFDKDNSNISKNEQDKIIKRGSVISIKHNAIFEPILSVIQKVEEHNIYFRIPEMFLKSNVFKGDRIYCNVIQGQYEYILDGKISEIDINYPWLVEVSVDDLNKIKNNRRTKRYLTNFQSKVHSNKNNEPMYAIIKNVCKQGVGAVFKEEISPESLVDVNISISIGKNENLEFKAKIVRIVEKAGYNEYGLEIVEIDDQNKDLLDKLIYKLECDEAEYVLDVLK